MKKHLYLSLLLVFIAFSSCEKEPETELSQVAFPVTQSIAEFRASVKIQESRAIKESGKIYSWKDYIFINDKNEGVHIIDNTDAFNPKKLCFIKIPRNHDIAVKDDKLYADSGMDLLVFDISNMNNIKEITRIKDVFPQYYTAAPEGANFVDFQQFDPNQDVIIGYIIEQRKIEYAREDWVTLESNTVNDGGSSGKGGSMARFSIKGDHLYVAEKEKLSVFDISAPENPNVSSSENVGWGIETIFNYEDHLYLGSSTGMFIYSLENPEKPEYVSFLQHVLGCDPVVVKDNYAYVTIRGGNECEQDFNQLDVVDISDKKTPKIVKTYDMAEPYGLGVKEDWLFVCDGSAGLKVYDTKNTPDLRLINQFNDINTYDVIPLEEELLMVGGNTLYQYSYKGNELSLVSSFTLN
ncbi:LVIVD repeat-containing protein [Christiangramia salexigens]|uniref:LVIVD repeat-containing protein n=1 Tax=Christiangramia salexigens TaxID=1913577 RepID=A0A1L3J641_9FLAO|nr:hypothetical protein [Christiangramia salexigens]APG60560.1 hypothetical protein LPB144_09165 [Christiangramia salexigens]